MSLSLHRVRPFVQNSIEDFPARFHSVAVMNEQPNISFLRIFIDSRKAEYLVVRDVEFRGIPPSLHHAPGPRIHPFACADLLEEVASRSRRPEDLVNAMIDESTREIVQVHFDGLFWRQVQNCHRARRKKRKQELVSPPRPIQLCSYSVPELI